MIRRDLLLLPLLLSVIPACHAGSGAASGASDGGLLGVRAPLHEAEEPVVRPYWLVDDIEAAVAAAQRAGAEVLHPPLLIPGHGTFAITFQGGIQHGYWQD